mgnify:CR=1 FL=1
MVGRVGTSVATMTSTENVSASHGILAGDSIPDGATLQRELLRASTSGDKDYLQRVLNYDFDKNCVNEDGLSAVMLATHRKSVDAVVMLLQNGVSPDTPNAKGLVPLHTASEHGSVDIVKELVRHKASLDIEAPFVGTPAHVACKAGEKEIVEHLLAAGANTDITTSGETLISICTDLHNVEMLDIVMKFQPNTGILDLNGYTTLMRASQKGYTEIVRVLLSNKADPNIVSKEGTSAIYLADFMGHADIVTLLQQFGAVRTQRDIFVESFHNQQECKHVCAA